MQVLELPLPDLLKQLLLSLRSEGVVALQHHEQQDPQRPHVRVDWNMVYLGDDFWCHVSWSATKGINGVRRNRMDAEPKINEFDVLEPIYQNIFSLDVPMNDILIMQVL